MKSNVLKDKSYLFAIRIVKFYQYMKEEKKEFIISKQVVRSSTAIGPLIEEAVQDESKPDFIHKLSIANKEANETRYWIKLLRDTGFIATNEAESLILDVEELIKLLVAIIKSTKASINR